MAAQRSEKVFHLMDPIADRILCAFEQAWGHGGGRLLGSLPEHLAGLDDFCCGGYRLVEGIFPFIILR